MRITEAKLREVVRQELRNLLIENIVTPPALSHQTIAESLNKYFDYSEILKTYSSKTYEQMRQHIIEFAGLSEDVAEELAKLYETCLQQTERNKISPYYDVPKAIVDALWYNSEDQNIHSEFGTIKYKIRRKIEYELGDPFTDSIKNLLDDLKMNRFQEDVRKRLPVIIQNVQNLDEEKINRYQRRIDFMDSMQAFAEKKELDEEYLEKLKRLVIMEEQSLDGLIQAAELYSML
jgi:hypothetical protein